MRTDINSEILGKNDKRSENDTLKDGYWISGVLTGLSETVEKGANDERKADQGAGMA